MKNVETHHIYSHIRAVQEGEENEERANLRNMLQSLCLWGEHYTELRDERALFDVVKSLEISNGHAIILVDAPSNEFMDFISESPARVELIYVIGTSDRQKEVLNNYFSRINHCLSISHGHLSHTALIAALYKIISKNIFSVDKYLTKGTPIHSFALTRSEERMWYAEEISKFITDLGGLIKKGAPEYGRMASEVLDEFLMNAIWDAHPQRSAVARNIPITLRPNEAVHVQWGLDGNVLAIGVRDPNGTMTRDTLQNYSDVVLGTKAKKLVTGIGEPS